MVDTVQDIADCAIDHIDPFHPETLLIFGNVSCLLFGILWDSDLLTRDLFLIEIIMLLFFFFF